MLAPGDHIAVLDDDISGVIIRIQNDTVIIEDENGFEITYDKTEVVKIIDKNILYSAPKDMEQVLKEKEQPKKKNIVKPSKKERQQPPMEVDLHIDKLIKSYHRMSNYEMLNIQLDTAKRRLAFAIRKRIQRVVFIHGVGAGVLKAELEYLLRGYDGIKIMEADYKKYGLGAIEVYIPQNVTVLE